MLIFHHVTPSVIRACALGMLICTPELSGAQVSEIEIVAPSYPESQYDLLAREVQTVLVKEGLASSIRVTNIPENGGLVALARFASDQSDDSTALVVGSALFRRSVTLDGTRPLALLAGEPSVVVVAATSPLQSMDDLIELMKEDSSEVAWAGGSYGGLEHALAEEIVRAIGIDPVNMSYIGYNGSDEALASLLGGQVTVAVTSYNSFVERFNTGELRGLALSCCEGIARMELQTLREQKIEVAMVNWLGIVVSDNFQNWEFEALSDGIEQMVETTSWSEALAAHRWVDLYEPSEVFDLFLQEEKELIEKPGTGGTKCQKYPKICNPGL